MAVSRLHISVENFYMMTPGEFAHAIRQHAEITRIGHELLVQAQWESTRALMFNITCQNPYIKKERKPKKPQDLLRFGWEVVTEPEKDLASMREALIAIHVDAYKRNKNKPTKNK